MKHKSRIIKQIVLTAGITQATTAFAYHSTVEIKRNLPRQCVSIAVLAEENEKTLTHFEDLHVLPKQKKLIQLEALLKHELQTPEKLRSRANQLTRDAMKLERQKAQKSSKLDNLRAKAESLLLESADLEAQGKLGAAKNKRKRAKEVTRNANQQERELTKIEIRIEQTHAKIESKLLEAKEIEDTAPHVPELESEIQTIKTELSDLQGEKAKLEFKVDVTQTSVKHCKQLVKTKRAYQDVLTAVSEIHFNGDCTITGATRLDPVAVSDAKTALGCGGL